MCTHFFPTCLLQGWSAGYRLSPTREADGLWRTPHAELLSMAVICKELHMEVIGTVEIPTEEETTLTLL